MKYLIGQPDTCQIFIALGDWSEPVEIRTKPSDRKLFDKKRPAYYRLCRYVQRKIRNRIHTVHS